MRLFFAILTLVFINPLSNAQSLKISENGRYLTKADGSAFLWIGDTAWELFHKLDCEEATEFLKYYSSKITFSSCSNQDLYRSI